MALKCIADEQFIVAHKFKFFESSAGTFGLEKILQNSEWKRFVCLNQLK
jgi:hypothetical protein